MGCLYGRQHIGKTSTILATFPRALCFGSEEALTVPIQNTLGFVPQIYPYVNIPDIGEVDLAAELDLPAVIRDIDDQVEVLRVMASEAGQEWMRHFGTAYFDDQSLLTQAWFAKMEEDAKHNVASPYRTGAGNVNILVLYNALNKIMGTLAEEQRYFPFSVWSSAHLIEGGSNDNGKWITQPSLGSKNLANLVAGWYGTILWQRRNADAFDPWFKRCLYSDPDNLEKVVSKDRNGIAWDKTPANLRAILTASETKYELERLPGLEWQDDVMQKLADLVEEVGPNQGAVGETIRDMFSEYSDIDYIPGHATTDAQRYVRWAVQDGLALGMIRYHRSMTKVDKGWLAFSEESDKKGVSKKLPSRSK